MQTFSYPALFEPGEWADNIVVTFPDVPGAVSQGKGEADARAMAADALGCMLIEIVSKGGKMPKATPFSAEQLAERYLGLATHLMIAPDAEIALKIAVLDAFNEAGISKSELGRRLAKDEREVRRILDPDHATKMPALAEALTALGKRLVIGIDEAA